MKIRANKFGSAQRMLATRGSFTADELGSPSHLRLTFH